MMQSVILFVAGVSIAGAVLDDDGRVLVPLDRFCEAVGAEVKILEGLDHPAVCKGDLCIPLNGSGAETIRIEGETFVYLDDLAEPLRLKVERMQDRIEVKRMDQVAGLGSGQTPPAFTLPDLFTGEPVSSADYLGRKVVFYMWASW